VIWSHFMVLSSCIIQRIGFSRLPDPALTALAALRE
jgi:hypothetical protein